MKKCVESAVAAYPLYQEEGRGSIPTSTLLNMVEKACDGWFNYLVLSGQHYASDKKLISRIEQDKLFFEVGNLFFQLTGTTISNALPELGPDDVALIYIARRKWGDQKGKKKIPIGIGKMLFDEMNDDFMTLLYAYLGHTPHHGMLVKIGFTTQYLPDYLASKKISHDPKLLATSPGGRKEELAVHNLFRFHLAWGREWFRPVKQIFTFLRTKWKPQLDFDFLERMALNDNQGIPTIRPESEKENECSFD
jgi:hypothetical protein